MNDSATEQTEAYFINASPEKLSALRQSFCITEFSPFVLVGATIASSVALWTLIFSIL